LPPIVHILRRGFPLCGFNLKIPKLWPDGHEWISYLDKDVCTLATCEDCKRELQNGRSVVNTGLGAARACPLFTRLVDCLEPLSTAAALELKTTFGVGAVGRYLETLTVAEVNGLFTAGLPILLLTEAPEGPLAAALGQALAARHLSLAAALGAPKGVHLMSDFEAQTGDAGGYDNALTDAIASGGFLPLAYVGAGQLLTGPELYALPSVHLYWRGGSVGIPEPDCGFAVWQVPPLDQTLAGTRVDVSLVGADARGRSLVLWAPR
jgi:hypothetical protein